MADWTGQRKRRTREHIIEEMSANFLERKVLQRGHMLVRAPQREYGWDATMFQVTMKTIDRFGELSLNRLKRDD